MQRRDPPQVLVGGVGADTLEERADLPGPLLQVRTEDGQLLLVGELGAGEPLRPAALAQTALTAGPQVAHPLGVPAWRDEVAPAVVIERIHRRAAPLAALATTHLEDARADEADAETCKTRHDRVEDVLREPPRTLVLGRHRSVFNCSR